MNKLITRIIIFLIIICILFIPTMSANSNLQETNKGDLIFMEI
ncbi:MAG: hypothetical protein V8R51_03875 [Clostridia bacterium]